MYSISEWTNPCMSSCINITSKQCRNTAADNRDVVAAVFTLKSVDIMWCNFIWFLFFCSPHKKFTHWFTFMFSNMRKFKIVKISNGTTAKEQFC